ncbi:hypothetical protein C0J52_23256 [Blattella germanica]|nr:hypothetical protein C0J52_23256 [Blattella germanica]
MKLKFSSSPLHGLGCCLFRLHSVSFHLVLGLPLSLFPFGAYWKASFGSLVSSILPTCCNHLFLYLSILELTASASNSFHISSFLILSSLVHPLIFLKNFISQLCILFVILCVGTQLSHP